MREDTHHGVAIIRIDADHLISPKIMKWVMIVTVITFISCIIYFFVKRKKFNS